jgi:hypothetical protein
MRPLKRCGVCGIDKGWTTFKRGGGDTCLQCRNDVKRRLVDPNTHKRCLLCGKDTPVGLFKVHGRKMKKHCPPCRIQRQKALQETPEFTVKQVVATAIKRYQKRDGVDITLTAARVSELLEECGGVDWFCPAIRVSFKHKDSWRFSIIRQDTTRPIGDDNVRIVSQEWTTAGHIEWSQPLIEELKQSVGTPFDMAAFEQSILRKPPPKKHKSPCQDTSHVRKENHVGCWTCSLRNHQKLLSSGRSFIKKMLEIRVQQARKGGWQCDLTLDDVFAKIRAQQGMCFYFNVPLVFNARGGPRQASIERIDPSKDYTVDNFCFICLGLNTCCNRAVDKKSGPGEQSQWSREKADLVRRGWGLLQAE